MGIEKVQAPVSLLLDPDLTAAARVLWLALHIRTELVSRTRLAANSALTLVTVRKSLALLEAAGWYSPAAGPIDRAPADVRASIPVSLLAEQRVRPQGKLLYGILQTERDEFTHKALGARTGLSAVTVKQVIRELAETGWIEISQANQLAPIRFVLRIPELDRISAEVAQAKRRLDEAEYRGEALMREYLSLLIDSDEFEDNARPGFLINPQTNERMELDRYYPGVAAFEYNGAQHYRTTERFPSEQALATQKVRDLMKEALCARRGIRVVVINREDLTLETMQQKIGPHLPLRDLSGHQELVRLLEKVSRRYRS